MAYGPVTTADMLTSDMVAPGLVAFVASQQIDNQIIRLTLAMPSVDANGANLTGLTKLTVVTAAMTGGVNPFDGLSMSECLAVAGSTSLDVTLTEADAGQEKQVDVPVMNLGGMQAFAAACADD